MEREKVGDQMKAREERKRMVKRKRTEKKRMRAASMKAKGRALQQWVCEKISEVTNFQFGKDQPIESRPMGHNGVDVRMETSVLDLFPFSVECKNQEAWNIPSWVRQAKDNQVAGTSWLLVVKKNREKPIIIMDAEDFFMWYGSFLDVLEAVGKVKRPEPPRRELKRTRRT